MRAARGVVDSAERVRAPPAGWLAVRAAGQQELRISTAHHCLSQLLDGATVLLRHAILGVQWGSHVSGPLWCRCFRNAGWSNCRRTGCAQLGWPGHPAGRSGTGTIMAADVVFGIRNVPQTTDHPGDGAGGVPCADRATFRKRVLGNCRRPRQAAAVTCVHVCTGEHAGAPEDAKTPKPANMLLLFYSGAN